MKDFLVYLNGQLLWPGADADYTMDGDLPLINALLVGPHKNRPGDRITIITVTSGVAYRVRRLQVLVDTKKGERCEEYHELGV